MVHRADTGSVLRLFNLFSPVFDDRRAISRRVDEQMGILARLPETGLKSVISLRGAARKTKPDEPKPTDRLLPSLSRLYLGYAKMRLLSPAMFDRYCDMYTHFLRTRMYLDTMIVMLALSVYHDGHGRYPDALSLLVPDCLDAIPIDPYSGEAYRYRIEEDGDYLIYSVGTNGVDNGGKWKRGSGTDPPILDDRPYRIPKERRQPFIEWQVTSQPARTDTRDSKPSE